MTAAKAGPATAPALLLDQFEEIVASIALVVVVASVAWGVLTRYVTAQPAAWAGEVATLGFAWVVFFGASACIKYRLHPSIDMVESRLPAALQRLVQWTNHVLLLGFFCFMLWFGTRFALDSASMPTAVLRLPLVWLYGPVTFCFGLMIVRHVQVLLGRRWVLDELRETHAS